MKNLACVVATLLLCGAGCSWSQMAAPPSLPASPDELPSCTTSTLPVLVDSAAAVWLGLASAPGVYLVATEDDLKGTAIGGIVLAVGVAVVLAASATYGFQTARRCEQAHRIAALPLERRQTVWQAQVDRWRAKCARLRAEIKDETDERARRKLRNNLPRECDDPLIGATP